MAWLNATPKPPEGSKRAKLATKTEAKTPSRLEKLKSDGVTPTMPPNPAPHIIDRLVDIGLAGSDGMGLRTLCWLEIVAWQEANWVSLAPWEARLIRRLSAEYVAHIRISESENCPPPWKAGVTQREIDLAEARLRMVLG